MRPASNLGARQLLNFFGGRFGRIFLGWWWCWLFALALRFRVSDRRGIVRLPEADLLWRRVEETCFDARESFLGEEVDAIYDLIEERLAMRFSIAVNGGTWSQNVNLLQEDIQNAPSRALYLNLWSPSWYRLCSTNIAKRLVWVMVQTRPVAIALNGN